MNKRPSLTEKQSAVLDLLKEYMDTKGRVPTHSMLAYLSGVARTTITMHLATLESKGYILRQSRKWHDLVLLNDKDGAAAAIEWREKTGNA